MIGKQSSTKVVWNGTQHIQKKVWYSEGVGKKLEKQSLEISCTAAYEQLCYLVDEILVKKKWIMKMKYLLGKYTDSRNPLNLTQTTCLRNGSWIYQKLHKFTQFCFSLCSVFSAAIPTGYVHLVMACGEFFPVDIKQSVSWVLLWCICWTCVADFSSRYVIFMVPFFLTSISSTRQHTCSCAALCEISRCYLSFLPTSTLHHSFGCVVYVPFQTTWVELGFTIKNGHRRKSWYCF